MAYQNLGLGTAANDGSGDTLRDAGAKINANLGEIYNKFGNGSGLCTGVSATVSVLSLTAPNISGVVAGTQTSATITTLATTTVNGTTLKGGTLVLAAGSITDTSGAISFGNENITTTGTFGAGNITVGNIISSGASIIFEGATANTNEMTLAITDPTADRTITFADESGTVLTTGATNIVSGAMLKTASTLLIVNSGGTTLKTIIGSGVAS